MTNDDLYPVSCGVATKNLGTHSLLDLLVEGVPSPARKPSPIDHEGTTAFVFKTVADPFAGRISCFRVYSGTVAADSTLTNARDHAKERLGALMALQGKEHERADAFGAGDLGAVAKLKDVQTGDVLADHELDEAHMPKLDVPRAGDELRGHAEDEGRRGQGRAGPAAAARGGPDAAAAPRPADGRVAALRHEPGARRGRRRAAEGPLRRRRRPAPAARAVRRDDPRRGARRTAATRSRPAAVASSATATS